MAVKNGNFKPCGESLEKVCFSIAEVKIALLSKDPELKMKIEGAMKHFLTNGVDSDVEVQARWDGYPEKNHGKKIFDSGILWQLFSKNGSYFFRFASSTLKSLPYKVACFNHNFTKGEVFLNRSCFDPNQCIYPLEYPLDELLLVNHLSMGKGVEIHACGVVDSLGRGHLFVGQSRAGKSTMGRLWNGDSGTIVLSDDRIILRKIKDTIWMYGTPWHGDAGLASSDQVPLSRVYFLGKGQKNELIARKPSDSISRLFSCSFPPFYNPDALDFILSFLEDVVKTVPCYELKFTPDKSAIEFIQEERFT